MILTNLYKELLNGYPLHIDIEFMPDWSGGSRTLLFSGWAWHFYPNGNDPTNFDRIDRGEALNIIHQVAVERERRADMKKEEESKNKERSWLEKMAGAKTGKPDNNKCDVTVTSHTNYLCGVTTAGLLEELKTRQNAKHYRLAGEEICKMEIYNKGEGLSKNVSFSYGPCEILIVTD